MYVRVCMCVCERERACVKAMVHPLFTFYRGLEWLFGIESTETEDDRLKWEARQRRLRRLRTRNQLVPQPRQRAGRG